MTLSVTVMPSMISTTGTFLFLLFSVKGIEPRELQMTSRFGRCAFILS